MDEASARLYIAGWSVACVLALALAVAERKRLALLHRDYWRMLLAPWKLGSFLVAAVALTAVAPYTGDPTWDHTDAAFMAVATFLTAPWAVGTLWRALHGRVSRRQVPVAACLWLASASWSYDLYLYRRDGFYPATWASNLAALAAKQARIAGTKLVHSG